MWTVLRTATCSQQCHRVHVPYHILCFHLHSACFRWSHPHHLSPFTQRKFAGCRSDRDVIWRASSPGVALCAPAFSLPAACGIHLVWGKIVTVGARCCMQQSWSPGRPCLCKEAVSLQRFAIGRCLGTLCPRHSPTARPHYCAGCCPLPLASDLPGGWAVETLKAGRVAKAQYCGASRQGETCCAVWLGDPCCGPSERVPRLGTSGPRPRARTPAGLAGRHRSRTWRCDPAGTSGPPPQWPPVRSA